MKQRKIAVILSIFTLELSHTILRSSYALFPFCNFFQYMLGDILGSVDLAKWLHKFTFRVHEVKIDTVINKIIVPNCGKISQGFLREKLNHVRDSPSFGGGLEKYTR